MNVVFSFEAKRDLDDIFDFVLKDRPFSAQDILERIKEHIGYLCEHPYIGRPGRAPGTRELVLPNLPFIIPYQVKGDQLQILRVYHTARQWPAEL